MEGVPSHVLWYGLLDESVFAPFPVELLGSELCLLGQTPPVVEPDELDELGDGEADLCELVRVVEEPAEVELDELEPLDELDGSDELDEDAAVELAWLPLDEAFLPCPDVPAEWPLLVLDDVVFEEPDELVSEDELVEPESDEVDELLDELETLELEESDGAGSFFVCPGGEWSELPLSELATGVNPTVG